VLVNVARYLSIDPESALKKTNRKFKRRFQWMEEHLRASADLPNKPPWKNSKHYGSRRNDWKTSDRETDSIVIRNCHDLEELRTAVTLQKEVWIHRRRLVPLRLFVVAEKKWRASQSAHLTVRAWLALRSPCPVCVASIATLHSHMLAVLGDYRN